MRRQKKRKGDFMLDYRYQTFLVLADHLNYTKAAAVLSLSQPTVTKHIQYLENDLGIKLFGAAGLYYRRQPNNWGVLFTQSYIFVRKGTKYPIAPLGGKYGTVVRISLSEKNRFRTYIRSCEK